MVFYGSMPQMLKKCTSGKCIHILDLTRLAPGPHCTMILAGLQDQAEIDSPPGIAYHGKRIAVSS